MSSSFNSTAEGPRNFTTTPDDHAGIALVICTLMTTWTILCFVVRVYMRLTASGPFGPDDVLTGLATVWTVPQLSSHIGRNTDRDVFTAGVWRLDHH